MSFEGATGAQPSTTRTKDEANKLAKSYLRRVRRNPSQLEVIASQLSDGPTKTSAGDLGYFQEGQMTENLFKFANKSRVGVVGLVETEFGFHVVKIIDKQDLVL